MTALREKMMHDLRLSSLARYARTIRQLYREFAKLHRRSPAALGQDEVRGSAARGGWHRRDAAQPKPTRSPVESLDHSTPSDVIWFMSTTKSTAPQAGPRAFLHGVRRIHQTQAIRIRRVRTYCCGRRS